MEQAFTSLIQSLADNLGVPLNGEFQSPIEMTIDDMTVTLAYDARSGEPDLLMYATLGIVPEKQELAVYRTLLEGNVLWSGTADGTLGVNSATREAVLAYRMRIAGVSGEALAAVLGHFVEVAAVWSAYISAAGREGEEESAAPDLPFGGTMIRG